MSFVFGHCLADGEDGRAIHDAAENFLRREEPIAGLRRVRDGEIQAGFSADFWREIVQLGWPAIRVPEAAGGLGLGLAHLGVVLEQLGRHLAVSPLVSTSLLAGEAVSVVDGWERFVQSEDLAAGTFTATLAFDESPRFAPDELTAYAEKDGDGYRLHGRKHSVLDAHSADAIFVAARIGSADSQEIGLFAVPASTDGLSVSPQRWMDGRRAGDVELKDVALPASALLGSFAKIEDFVEPLIDRVSTALAAELVGLSASAFETTLEYLQMRVQFGRPLASFQALQHRMARMFADIELSVSLTQEALRLIDAGDDGASAAASAAKAHASDLARHVTNEAVQLHGGIGMTEEHDIGLFMKRARVTSTLWGDSGFHYARYARLQGF